MLAHKTAVRAMRRVRRGRNLLCFSCLLAFTAAATVAHAQSAAPAVSSITFHDSPARGGTYELGERVQVEVRFDSAVKATGSPQVALTIGTQTRFATYASWGGLSLYFDYTVQETDRDEDGISIAANELILNGGTIKAAAGTTDADLTHGAVAAARGNKVDGSLASPPVVNSIFFDSPAKGDTYELGETIELVVEFHRAVTVTDNPQVALTIGTQTRQAAYSRSWGGDRMVHFSYAVQEGDRDEDGFSVAANALALNGGTIKAADGTTDADLTHWAEAAEGDRKVNASLVSPPAVKRLSFISSPARDDTYELGETVEVAVEFDRVVTATGTPQLALTIGTETWHATFSGWGSHPALYFQYTVQGADRDEDGISIAANALALDGGTIKGPDGATDADLTHAAVAAEGGSKVDGSLVSPPAVKSIFFFSSPARDDTYESGETIGLIVQFDRVVTATGRSRLALTIGEETRHATSSGWGSSPGLFFDYTVQEGDRDEDGISIAANALALDGGTIKGPDGTTDADLTHEAVADARGAKVDGSLASPPAVKGISFISSVGRDDTYELGEPVEVMVEFHRAVRVTGSPQVTLTIGSETRHAAYSTSRGDDRYVHFSYAVQEGDRDEEGISIAANALLLNGGTIKAADGLTDADLTHAAVAPDRNRKVDGSSAVTPSRVRAISFDSLPARGDTYELGETVEVVVEFDGAVKATGEPQVALTIGTQTRPATFSGWGGRSLYFHYTVQGGDRDEDGISIAANALALNGGTITAADATTEAVLTHEAVAPEGASKVNGSDITPPGVRYIYLGSSPARGDTYEFGETVEVEVGFDRAVTVTGNPLVALTIGTETRHATMAGWGSDALYFDYTVREGDRDEDGISIPANAIVLNGGTITAADRTTDADLTHGAVGAEGGSKVHGSLITPPRVRDILFISSPARGSTYELGETIEVEVGFDRAVTVTGNPQVVLTIGQQTRPAAYLWGDDRYAHFSYVVQEGDRDEDGISIAANVLVLNGGTITAADGTTDADLTHEAVAAERGRKVNGSLTTVPGVRDISFISFPARGDTYELGETVEVLVEFDGAVKATGNPQVALTIGKDTRLATFSGWGRDSLYFDYSVEEGDRDEDGISIPANALVFSGGTITAADGTTHADLAHPAVAAERGRKVDSSLIRPPRVRGIVFISSPARGDTYELGETLELQVEFDRTVTVTGTPQVTLTIGAQTRHAAYSMSWGDDRYAYFSYVVQAGNRDEDGISIASNALLLNGGTITAADGTTDADLTHAAVAAEGGNKVNGSSDVTPPRVRDISFISSPARGATYELGETVEVVVEFDGAVKATGEPQVALTIGTQTRPAALSGWGNDSLYFNYTVLAGDRDEDGISIASNALALNGGTITAADGRTEAVLTHEAVAPEGASKVNGGLVRLPGVRDVSFISSPAKGDTYELGETIEVVVEFDRAVTATGSPQVSLNIGSETRHATSSGWGDESLYFDYTVQEGDRDEDGISIAANALDLNGGTIRAADGMTDADLRHDAVAAEGGSKVNGSLVTPPGVRDIFFISFPARGDTYELGETIEVLVEFDRAVTVTGSPQVALIIGTQTRQAAYSASWDDRYAYFSYAVQEADRDEDGISIAANALDLNGGTIKQGGYGTAEADLTHDAVAADPALKVNGSLVTPPVVTAIYLDNHVPPPSGDTYVRGERVRVWVEFDRDVIVTGGPQVALTIGSQTKQASYSGFSIATVSGGGTIVDKAVLSFDYMVRATDSDEDGVSIPAGALALNGGTITHAGDATVDADLTHGAVAADPGRRVNGSLVTP